MLHKRFQDTTNTMQNYVYPRIMRKKPGQRSAISTELFKVSRTPRQSFLAIFIKTSVLQNSKEMSNSYSFLLSSLSQQMATKQLHPHDRASTTRLKSLSPYKVQYYDVCFLQASGFIILNMFAIATATPHRRFGLQVKKRKDRHRRAQKQNKARYDKL